MSSSILAATGDREQAASRYGLLGGTQGGQHPPAISRRSLLTALGASALMLSLPAGGRAEESPLAAYLSNEIETLFWNMNGVRNLYELAHLHRSPNLDQSAFAHAADMAAHNFLAHTSSDGTDLFTRILSYYPYGTWLGENLAVGFGTGLEVLEAWRASAPHNAVLLQPEFNAVGLACVAQHESPAGWFWAADFGGAAA